MVQGMLKTRAAAQYLGCSETSITRWVRAGYLETSGKGRAYLFTPENLDRFGESYGHKIRGPRGPRWQTAQKNGDDAQIPLSEACGDKKTGGRRWDIHQHGRNATTGKGEYAWITSIEGPEPGPDYLREVYGPGKYFVRTDGLKDRRWTIGPAPSDDPAPQAPAPQAPASSYLPDNTPADGGDKAPVTIINPALLFDAIEAGPAAIVAFAALLNAATTIIEASANAEDPFAFYQAAMRHTRLVYK